MLNVSRLVLVSSRRAAFHDVESRHELVYRWKTASTFLWMQT